jgi:hypothetical protein
MVDSNLVDYLFIGINFIFILVLLTAVYKNYNIINYYDINKKFCKEGDRIEKDYSVISETLNVSTIKGLTIFLIVFNSCIALLSLWLVFTGYTTGYFLLFTSAILLILLSILLSNIATLSFKRDLDSVLANSEKIFNSCFGHTFSNLPQPIKSKAIKNYVQQYEAEHPGQLMTLKNAEQKLNDLTNDTENSRVKFSELIKYLNIPGDIDTINQEYHANAALTNCTKQKDQTQATCTKQISISENVTDNCIERKTDGSSNYVSKFVTDNSKDIKDKIRSILVYTWAILIVLVYLAIHTIYDQRMSFYIIAGNLALIVVLMFYYMMFVRE